MANLSSFYRMNRTRMYPLLAIRTGEEYVFGADTVLPRQVLLDALIHVSLTSRFDPALDNTVIYGIKRHSEPDSIVMRILAGSSWIADVVIRKTNANTCLRWPNHTTGQHVVLQLGEVADFIDSVPEGSDWLRPPGSGLVPFEPSCVVVEPPLVTALYNYNDPRPRFTPQVPYTRVPPVQELRAVLTPDPNTGYISLTQGVNIDLAYAEDAIRITPRPGAGMGKPFQTIDPRFTFYWGNPAAHDYRWWYGEIYGDVANQPDGCAGILYLNSVPADEDGRLEVYSGLGINVEVGESGHTLILKLSTNKQEKC